MWTGYTPPRTAPFHLAALGADFYATSAYKWSGPHVGAVIADPALLETLHPDRATPLPTGTERFSRAPALCRPGRGHRAVGDLAELDAERGLPPPRQRLLTSMAAVEAHEQSLFHVLQDGLAGMGDVTATGRWPTGADRVLRRGRRRRGHVARYLAGRGINVWSGHNYAWELTARWHP